MILRCLLPVTSNNFSSENDAHSVTCSRARYAPAVLAYLWATIKIIITNKPTLFCFGRWISGDKTVWWIVKVIGGGELNATVCTAVGNIIRVFWVGRPPAAEETWTRLEICNNNNSNNNISVRVLRVINRHAVVTTITNATRHHNNINTTVYHFIRI